MKPKFTDSVKWFREEALRRRLCTNCVARAIACGERGETDSTKSPSLSGRSASRVFLCFPRAMAPPPGQSVARRPTLDPPRFQQTQSGGEAQSDSLTGEVAISTSHLILRLIEV
ncbi:hypothetical protein chiPu_0012124 [Chiloscyllium punctatum]|uniref:Uncharacterized protein n=1 Tax=Chiloscyllium punctatum TaxID=137246 RepID=A0A401STD0_CHIPU|nr:hypothetical protein [Chiloscyllium punctatum]